MKFDNENYLKKFISIPKKEYYELLKSSIVSKYYQKLARSYEDQLNELSDKALHMRFCLEADLEKRQILLAEQLGFVLNEAELYHDKLLEYGDRIGADPLNENEEIEKTVDYIRKNVSHELDPDDCFDYLRHRIYLTANGQYCPECCREMKIIESFPESEISIFENKLCLKDNSYVRMKCMNCGLEPPQKLSPPENVGKILIKPEVIARFVTLKFCSGISFAAQAQTIQDAGGFLSARTITNWFSVFCREHIAPLKQKLRTELVNSDVIYYEKVEPDYYAVREDDNPYFEPDCTIHIFVGVKKDGSRIVCIEKTGTDENGFLRTYLKGFSGILVSNYISDDDERANRYVWAASWSGIVNDLTVAYECLFPSLQADSIAAKAIKYCDKLYMIEEKIKELDSNYISDLREKLSAPVIDELIEMIKGTPTLKEDFAKETLTGKALFRILDNESALRIYIDNGIVDIDNSAAKNIALEFDEGEELKWMLSKTPSGNDDSLAVLSVIKTAEANNAEPYRYLCYYLKNHDLTGSEKSISKKLLPYNAPPECKRLTKSF